MLWIYRLSNPLNKDDMTRKITAIVVDDEPHAIQQLTRLAEGIESLEIVDTFTDPLKALKSLRTNYVDLVLLDVEMEPVTGLQFLVQMPAETKAVLVSAYDKYAVSGYEYRVCDYLRKPVSFDRLATAVNWVGYQMGLDSKKRMDDPDDYFYFLIKGPTRYQRTMIRFDDLIYLEALAGRTLFHLQHKETTLLSKTQLGKIIPVLPPDRFMQVHRSFIVNLDYFDNYNSGEVIMKGPGMVLPVGKKANYPDFFKWLERHSL